MIGLGWDLLNSSLSNRDLIHILKYPKIFSSFEKNRLGIFDFFVLIRTNIASE